MNRIQAAFAALIATAFSAPALAAPADEAHGPYFRAERQQQQQVAMLGDLSAPARNAATSTRTMVADPTGASAGTITIASDADNATGASPMVISLTGAGSGALKASVTSQALFDSAWWY